MAEGDFVPGQDYVVQNPDTGEYDVYVGGEYQGSTPDAGAAGDLYNTFFPDQQGGGAGVNAGGPGGLVPGPGGLMPGSFGISAGIALNQSQLDLQRMQQEYLRARMEMIDKPSMEAEIRYKEALVRMQEARDAFDQQKAAWERADTGQRFDVGSRMDIWKQRGNLAEQFARNTGFYKPPEEEPTLPYHYQRDQLDRDFRAQYGRSPTPEEANRILPGYTAGIPGSSPSGPPNQAANIGAIHDWAANFKAQAGHAPSPQDFESTWGAAGKALADYTISHGYWPSKEEAMATLGGTNFNLPGAAGPGGVGETPKPRGIASPGGPSGGVSADVMPGGTEMAQTEPYRFPASTPGTRSPQTIGGPQGGIGAGNGGNRNYQLKAPPGTYVSPEMMTRWGELTGYTPEGQATADWRKYMQTSTGFTGEGGVGGAKTLERENIEAQIEDARKRTALAESQGNEELARKERERLDALEGARTRLAEESRQFNVGQSGYMEGTNPGGAGGGWGGIGGRAGETIGGRAQSLAEQQAQWDREFREAQMAANPENAATVAALRGQAPWQRAMAETRTPQVSTQPQARQAQVMGGGQPQPQTPASAGGYQPFGNYQRAGIQDPRQMDIKAYERMKASPSQAAAFGSFAKAAGSSAGDYEEEMKQFRPQQTRMQAVTGTWR